MVDEGRRGLLVQTKQTKQRLLVELQPHVVHPTPAHPSHPSSSRAVHLGSLRHGKEGSQEESVRHDRTAFVPPPSSRPEHHLTLVPQPQDHPTT